MLVRRCAWHAKYHGHPWLFGIASWRGRGIDFTDGLCHGCAEWIRAEAGVEIHNRGRLVILRPAFAALATVALVLLPHTLDYLPPRLLPVPATFTVTVAPAAADEPAIDAVPEVAPVLALLTSAIDAVDGPVAQPPARRSPRVSRAASRPAPTMPTRADIRFYDDPASPLALFSVQAP